MFETLGSHSIHTEWITPINFLEAEFDSHLRIKDNTLKLLQICLQREAMRLQCFPPTHYVRGGLRAHKNVTTITNLTKIEVQAACLHCMVLL